MFEIKNFAERLKTARTKRGLSQAELAKAVSVSAATISSYETLNNTKIPSLDKAAAMADFLGVSLDWLCGKDSAGKVPITNFDIDCYLRALVVVITEMTSTFTVDLDNKTGSILITKFALVDFIKQCADVMAVYRNGTLTTELYETCIEKIISKYSFGVFKYDNILVPRILKEIENQLCKADSTAYLSPGITNLSVAVDEDEYPFTIQDFKLFISEKNIEDFWNQEQES